MAYVYKLIETNSGSFYIGSTSNHNKRYMRHIKALEKGIHHNSFVQDLFNAGGTFVMMYDKFPNREDAYTAEDKDIKDNINNSLLLNIGMSSRGGDNLTRNPKRDSIIKKITASLKKRYSKMNPEERQLRSGSKGAKNGMFGKHHTVEAKRKMSLVNKGRVPHNKGEAMSEEQRLKLVEHAKQRNYHGVKNPFHGKTHSEAVKRRLSVLAKARINTTGKSIQIHGKVYKSMAMASRDLNLKPASVSYRCRSKAIKNKDWLIL